MKPSFDIKILHTTDVHGCFFPFDFIERKPCSGSMARVSSYVKRLRKKYGRRLLLVDGGVVEDLALGGYREARAAQRLAVVSQALQRRSV